MTSPSFFSRKPPEEKSQAPKPQGLLALTPKYDEGQHGVYLKAIEAALNGPESDDIKNIALTGGYGVGKSSILKEVVKRHKRKVVQVSLSTLGFVKDGQDVGNESKTNVIQKEIVKQLLYREEPVKMSGSRFRRIERFKKLRSLGLSALVAGLMTLISYLAGWTAQLGRLARPVDLNLWIHAIIFGAFTLAAFAALALFHNRVQIRQFKVADTDISLSDDADSYFDQYLDEIVYFFDVTKRDIVIFEDIDRFDDAHIFETLRALNTLLNGAGQLHRRRIRFIYAIKDSIFAKLGQRGAKEEVSGDSAAETTSDFVRAEVERANRTKFFDLVIPVVPFITHRNARNLMDKVLVEIEHNIKPDLIDLAAGYVTDMRLLKNVRNEFVIFKQKVMTSDDGQDLDLDDSSLFAMMLYKSTHLGDFEKIKAGTSELDTLYGQFRSVVELTRQRHTAEAQKVRRQIADLDTADTRSRDFGEGLLAYAARIRRHLAIADRAVTAVSFGGQERTDEELHASAFWQEFAGSDGELQVSFNDRGTQRGQLTITKGDAVEILGGTLTSAESWDEAIRTPLQNRLAEIDAARDELSHGDMNLLMEHDEYIDEDGTTFREHAKKLGSLLAQDLVAGGYLGRDFTLYTSTYYSGRVSTRAQNFLMHNVTRKAMDIHYLLEADDVDAIVKEQGDSVLREHGMYNISVFDHLLAPRAGEPDDVFAERDRRANLLVRGLTTYGADEAQFLDSYLEGGAQRESLVRKLAPRWGQILDFLMKQVELDADVRLSLFNLALGSLGGRVTYVVKDNGVRAYIEEHFTELVVLTDAGTGEQVADHIVRLLVAADVKIPRLRELGDDVRSAAIASSTYALTRPNLEVAHGDASIALDQLRGGSEVVYRYALLDLDAYLAALRDGHPDSLTVSVGDALASIVADIASKTPDALPTVLDGAVAGSEVASLASVPQSAWPALADRLQFPATFSNVTAYFAAIGEIDAHLGARLAESKAIATPEDTTESDRLTLAGQVVSAHTAIPDPAVRVALAKSIDLPGWLPLGSVPAEKGHLIGLLIENVVIPDDAQSFALALNQDWSTRENAIDKSEEFVSFMTPTEVPLSDVAHLMVSTVVPDAVKDVVLAREDEFVPTDDRVALTALANHALRGKKPEMLPITLVTRMATSGVASDLVVGLLEPLLTNISETQLVVILAGLGWSYVDVSARNGKQRRKLPNSPADLALVNRLEALGIVSTYKADGKSIKVNMKKQ